MSMSELSAQMMRDHVAQMNAITEKGTRQAQEWSTLSTKLADKFSSGEVTVHGLINRERQEIAERLKQSEETAEAKS